MMRRFGMLSIMVALWLDACGGIFTDAAGMGDDHPPGSLASIRVRNPTGWKGPLLAEVPVGRLASPGLIDWTSVRLAAEDGTNVPFALREGRPHWQARLTAPVTAPRAEDLLVFAVALPHEAWTRIDVVTGPERDATALSEKDGRLTISYPGMEVTVVAATGILTRIVAFGESILDKPLAVSYWGQADQGGGKQPFRQPRTRLVARSSTAGMTELHFVMELDARLSLALSYRIHAFGLVEIGVDERPWQGVTPWIDHAGQIALPLAGTAETLPYLVNRAPHYGFKDYASVVKHEASVWRLSKARVLQMGEETTNGRRWNRRLYILRGDHELQSVAAWANAVDKGLLLDVVPADQVLPAKEVRIASAPETRIAAEHLRAAFQRQGREVQFVTHDAVAEATLVLRQVAFQDAPGIEGDGFEIRPAPRGHGVLIRAGTRFGLVQAALRTAEYLARPDAAVRVPLVASNPAAQLRAGGFGGGSYEVDFPYGSEEEWQKVLGRLVVSGMNVMTDLGMWSNWKMPVTYRYMPELQAATADAYDEVSGAKFAEWEIHRARAHRLLRFLHDRGVKAWLWLPVGCVPTTYASRHPEAMSPGDRFGRTVVTPCFTHPLYHRYLEAFLKELLETYEIDGIVMIRDDNGGRCHCPRCKAYVGGSQTKNAAWEQYQIVYRWLRSHGFSGDVGVYPYHDLYEPQLDPLLPTDLYVVGHGSGKGMLARDYCRLGPMGDTWLDNLFAGFRPPTTARLRRLLGDRNAFWIGGAFHGAELPWEAIGYFGWEPTASVNSFRYQSCFREFGPEHALAAAALMDTYEELWEIYDLPMLPAEWMSLGSAAREVLVAQAGALVQQFRRRLAALRESVADRARDPWFSQVALFGTYLEYHLQRLDGLARMHDLVLAHRDVLDRGERLPQPLRQELLALHEKTRRMAKACQQEAALVPSAMLAATRSNGQLRLFGERALEGYRSCDDALKIRQFAGTIAVSIAEATAGAPLHLRIEVCNRGVYPWQPDDGPCLQLDGATERLGLPRQCPLGPPMVFGDRRTVELHGKIPAAPGAAELHLSLAWPFSKAPPVVHKVDMPFVRKDVELRWK